MMWDNVVYEPGELKVVAFDEQGKTVDSVSVFTAGKPHKLLLEADKSTCGIPGANLVYITVTMLDEQAIPFPMLTKNSSSPCQVPVISKPYAMVIQLHCSHSPNHM